MAQTTDDHQTTDGKTLTPNTARPGGQSPLVARGVVKAFANVAVLKGVDLAVAPGEIHALLGSNGSGKSTFVKLITGTYSADAGTEITLDGKVFGADLSPHDARAVGVRTVHQESPLIGQMTVAEHFGLDRGFPTGRGLWVRRRPLHRMAREALDRVGASIDPGTFAKDLLAAERAQVSLALAMTDIEPGHGLLVLDEATALLPAPDAKPILERVAALAAEGVGVLMVTHRLREVTDYCHNVTVLRDGAVVHNGAVSATNHDELVNAMVGRTADGALAVHHERIKRVLDQATPPIVAVRELSGHGIEDVTFDVRPGEILGFAGIVGSGASEVGRMVTGADPADSGTIAIAGRDAPRRWTPRAAMDAGICFVPQDRHAEGGVLTLSLADNVSLPRYSHYWRRGAAEREDVEGVITELDVQPPIADKPFAEFSGGNQQKALLGKWLLLDPKVLVLDDPTYGVDPNAREVLLRAVAEVADRGAAVIVISTEPEQLARICDRVLVMRSGRVSAELTGDNINEVEISLACFS
jgi:ribose transport system ATP-binding protein